ncbi:MAG: hypothetical protein Q4C34_04455 [Bacteroidales bacterium]|nr:hypothetical protein [Bacteroidales bacterium]
MHPIATSKDKTIRPAGIRFVAVLNSLLAIAFMVTIASGIWLNTAWRDDSAELVTSLRTWHLVAGIVSIISGCMHIWVNRGWYRHLLQVEPSKWYCVVQYRLMPVFTMLFVAVAVTGILILCGLHGLISFHQGCGLLIGVFAIGHMVARLKALIR